MVRKKIKIKRIENATTRQVTFSKRRGGLLKKAHDLAVLCDADVGVIVFSSKGKLFSFASPSMGSVLERYTQNCGNSKAPNNNDLSHVNGSATNRLTEFFDRLKSLQSNLIGDDYERLSLRDLIRLELQIQDNLGQIRAKKEELFMEQLEYIKEKVTEAQRTATMNPSIVEKLVDFVPEVIGSQDLSGQEDSENACPQEAPPTNASSSPCEPICEGLPAANKRSRITEDLNKSPAPMED